MTKRSRETIFPVLALLAMMSGACGDDRTPLVLYSPHGRNLLELVEREFELQRPEIDVRWLDMGSQEVFDRVRSERSNPQADVWFGGPDVIFARGAEAGLLQTFRPEWADHLPAESRDAEGLYFGLYLAVPILMFNSEAVTGEEVPEDWDDLLDARWRGKIIIRDPLASGTMRTAFGMILERSLTSTGDTARGMEWLRRLDAQTADYTVNPALLFEKLARQEGLVTIWELTDALLLQEQGAPIDYRFPSSGTPVIDDSIGLVAGARHPEAARSFIEWVGSREALGLVAREVYRLPARLDMSPEELPEWAQQALAGIVRAEVDWQLIEERGQEWMRQWDREVRGRG
jgi:iron(III) transport system substrate-binding protein